MPSPERFRGVVNIGALLAVLWFLENALAGFGNRGDHDTRGELEQIVPALVAGGLVCALMFAGLRRLVARGYSSWHSAPAVTLLAKPRGDRG